MGSCCLTTIVAPFNAESSKQDNIVTQGRAQREERQTDKLMIRSCTRDEKRVGEDAQPPAMVNPCKEKQ